ncbi:HipA domain-containing protein [Pseudomonas sp. CGJS7]|uniref:HipA domain-containing protein n=1 Tax=Pseudomonas sp. CGJS7 TaxID=3109348 RepID=UPI00300937CA
MSDSAITVVTLDGLHYPPRQLDASIDGQQVGVLSESAGVWEFAYAPEWLRRADRFPLSPALPLSEASILDGSSVRPVQWYFDNLLPEDVQRRLMAADAKITDADAFGLLSYYGSESAGSLTLLPPNIPIAAGDAIGLSDADLSARIRAMPQQSLASGAAKRMSLAGAQHKLAVIVRDGQLLQPVGSEPSTHILKPDHPGADYPHSVANEWFVMRLAKQMGLEVPAVDRRYVPEPVYLIERFDRRQSPQGVQRLHAIDACQLLNLDRQFKYQQGSVEILARIAELCRYKLKTRWRLYDWLIFNALTGNSDAHLKNLSFLVDAEGVNLAPHYDLLSTVCYESMAYERDRWPLASLLSWPILGATRFSDLNFGLLVEAGAVLRLTRKHAQDRLAWMRDSILSEAESLIEAAEAQNALLPRVLNIGPRLLGEMRCLRAIKYTVIEEMVRRLTPP